MTEGRGAGRAQLRQRPGARVAAPRNVRVPLPLQKHRARETWQQRRNAKRKTLFTSAHAA